MHALLVLAVIQGKAIFHPAPPRPTPPPPADPSSRIIFLHRCLSDGCLVTQGNDDSRTDHSSIASGQVVIGPFTQSDAVWASLLQCVKDTYAPFDVTVTDVDPGNVPHFENVVGGKANQLIPDEDPNTVAGLAVLTCTEIPNAMSFTFDVWGPDALDLCGVVAQEVAHGFGLDHEYLGADPMSYLAGPLPKRYQPVDARCGTDAARDCRCGGPTQNSYALILALFGPGAGIPPMVSIRSPLDGATVQPGFVVRVDATDDIKVDHTALALDGMDSGVTSAADPFWLATPPTGIADGDHAVTVTAFNVEAITAQASINVTMGPACTADSICTGKDVCVSGVCQPGPSAPGGIGYRCDADTECLSRRCVADSTGDKQCTDTCTGGDPTTCPNGFECLDGANVCWRDATSGGCCSTGGSPNAVLAAAVPAGVLRRRRRR